ncbi:LexA repressor [compost metagenome]
MIQMIPADTCPKPFSTPLFTERCQAGFPSPAADWLDAPLDLNTHYIRHPSATYFVRASGESMNECGILSGDLLIVDRAIKPIHGSIVVAAVDNEFTVKRLFLHPKICLMPMNPDFHPIYPNPETLEIFGVVTHAIHDFI